MVKAWQRWTGTASWWLALNRLWGRERLPSDTVETARESSQEAWKRPWLAVDRGHLNPSVPAAGLVQTKTSPHYISAEQMSKGVSSSRTRPHFPLASPRASIWDPGVHHWPPGTESFFLKPSFPIYLVSSFLQVSYRTDRNIWIDIV